MFECLTCMYYGSITDENDKPRCGCKNPLSAYYNDWVCSDFYCSRYSAVSCSTCVHEVCGTPADKEVCSACEGWVSCFAEYEPVSFEVN